MPEPEAPEEFPQTTPPIEMFKTSDIRLVMIEVAKLSTLVERLIKDVSKQEDKIDALRHQATYLKGGIAVATVALALFGWFVTQMVNGKLEAALSALTAHK